MGRVFLKTLNQETDRLQLQKEVVVSSFYLNIHTKMFPKPEVWFRQLGSQEEFSKINKIS